MRPSAARALACVFLAACTRAAAPVVPEPCTLPPAPPPPGSSSASEAPSRAAPSQAAPAYAVTDVDDHMDVLDDAYDRFFRRAQSAPFEPTDWPHLRESAPRAAEAARALVAHPRGPGWDVLSLAVADASTALAAAVAAEPRDEEAIREHLETIGAACSGCHDEYR